MSDGVRVSLAQMQVILQHVPGFDDLPYDEARDVAQAVLDDLHHVTAATSRDRPGQRQRPVGPLAMVGMVALILFGLGFIAACLLVIIHFQGAK